MLRRRTAPPEALLDVLVEWWLDGEGLIGAEKTVDHGAAAVRGRYTERALRARYPAADASTARWLAGFVDWAASYAARQLHDWLRDGLRAGRTTPERLPARVRTDLRAALAPEPARRGAGPRTERFDPDAHLDTVVERGRARNADGFIGL